MKRLTRVLTVLLLSFLLVQGVVADEGDGDGDGDGDGGGAEEELTPLDRPSYADTIACNLCVGVSSTHVSVCSVCDA